MNEEHIIIQRQFINYVKTSIVHKVIDFAKKENRKSKYEISLEKSNEVSLSDKTDNGTSLAFEHTLNDIISSTELYNAITKLNDEEKKILEMVFVKNMEIEEVAKILGKSKDSIYSHKNRILKKLKSELDK